MCAAALHQAQLDRAALAVDSGLENAFQHLSQSTHLGVAEGVLGGFAGVFRDEFAIFIVDALGGRDNDLALFFVDPLCVVAEFLHVKGNLGQIEQIRALAAGGGESGCAGKPSGVPAHDFDNADHARIVDFGVQRHFHAGGGNVFGGTAKAGAVIGSVEVVVDGLGDADYIAIIANGFHITADLGAGVH